MEKINRESKKFYERELKQYWENKKRLCRLLDRAEKAVYDKNTSSRTIISVSYTHLRAHETSV